MSRTVLLLSSLFTFGFLTATACEGGASPEDPPNCMAGATADCEYAIIHIQVGDASPIAFNINGLAVEEVAGAEKSGPDSVEVVARRGVRFSTIFAALDLSVPDDTPVNCVARDGWDPLRSRLEGEVTALPTFGFFRDNGYLFAGSPCDKDPLFPLMEGKSLMVDYDLASDAEVPASLGGTLYSISIFRFMMVEMVRGLEQGVFEIDPIP